MTEPTPTEDWRTLRGGLDSQAWLLNNTHNAGTPNFDRLRNAARKDRDEAVEALSRLQRRYEELEADYLKLAKELARVVLQESQT